MIDEYFLKETTRTVVSFCKNYLPILLFYYFYFEY